MTVLCMFSLKILCLLALVSAMGPGQTQNSPFSVPPTNAGPPRSAVPPNALPNKITLRMSDESPQESKSTSVGEIEILSDTKGLDFGPYIFAMKPKNTAPLVCADAANRQAQTFKSGESVVTFGVMPDGKVEGLRFVRSSGIIALDRAAYGAVSYSTPFNELPLAFPGKYLLLRTTFHYNLKEAQEAYPPEHSGQKLPPDSKAPKTPPQQ